MMRASVQLAQLARQWVFRRRLAIFNLAERCETARSVVRTCIAVLLLNLRCCSLGVAAHPEYGPAQLAMNTAVYGIMRKSTTS